MRIQVPPGSREPLFDQGALSAPARDRILLIEDDVVARLTIAKLLGNHFEVLEAPEGQVGLELARRDFPDLVLSDISMPLMDGFAFLNALRAHSSTASIPVIFLSGDCSEEARVRGFAAGAVDYVGKPFSERELVARVQAQLRHARARRVAELREMALRSELSDLRLRFDAMVGGVTDQVFLLDPEWRFAYVNTHLARASGGVAEEVLGKCIWELFPDLRGTLFEREVRNAASNGQCVHFDYYYERWKCWYQNHVYPSAAGLAFFVINLSRRQTLREESREADYLDQYARRRDFLHDLPFPCRVVDPGGRVGFFNKAAAEVWGREAETGGWDAAGEGLPPKGPDGKCRWNVSAPLTEQTDGVDGVLRAYFAIDVTALGEAHDQLRTRTEALTGRVRELEDALAQCTAKLQNARAELQLISYGISHDLRSPLRTMHGFGQILLEQCGDQLNATGQDCIRRILNSAQRMDRLIQDFLAYSRLSPEDMPQETIEVRRLLDGIIDSYPLFRAARAAIEIAPPLPLVRGNTGALTLCLSHLIDNALKFVPAGVTPRVRISAETNDRRARLIVQDNGIGIDPSARGKIFDLFCKLTHEHGGTGIGLPLVRKAAECMGGDVGFDSEPGCGSRFFIELNLPDEP